VGTYSRGGRCFGSDTHITHALYLLTQDGWDLLQVRCPRPSNKRNIIAAHAVSSTRSQNLQTTIDCVRWEPLLSEGLAFMASTEIIDHSALVRLVENGSVSGTIIVAKPGGWSVEIRQGSRKCALTAQRSGQVRLFKRLETLVTYLQGLGISQFNVDASGYDPLQLKTYARPDRSEALKQAHEAAAYEEWFKRQVQISIDDPRPSISDEDARRIFAAKRDALRQRGR
jgi:hypothetical protein